MSSLYPLRFQPVYQPYLWGGEKIIRHYHRTAPPGRYAESWEISDRPEGMSVVANGACAGRTLADIVRAWGSDLLGRRVQGARFPLLIKLIDAAQTLSVQVHPDDQAAAQFGGEAKTEMWYTLQADPGAFVYNGVVPGTDEAAFLAALAAGQVETLLRRVPVQAGQRIFVPGGRMHAIGAGALLLEVQQNSNSTYRVHDWNRRGDDGVPRVLHLEEAMRVTRWTDDFNHTEAETPHFQLMELNIAFEQRFRPAGESFHVLFVAEGLVRLNGEDWPAGSTALIPAALPEYVLYPINGPVKVLRVTVPAPADATPTIARG
jgi:mannose-6-phosphate isomerase